MKRVATAAVLIPAVLWLVFRGPFWLRPLVLAGLALGCIVEYEHLVEAKGIRIRGRLLRLFGIAPFVLPLAFAVWPKMPLEVGTVAAVVVVILLAPFCLVVAHMWSDLEECLVSAGVSTLGLLYVSVSLVCLWNLWNRQFGSLFVFFVLVVVWSGDISAYYTGKNLGRTKLAPRISPGKTWEGAIASFVVSVALGAWILLTLEPLLSWLVAHELISPVGISGWPIPHYPHRVPHYPLWFAVAASAVVNIAAQLGDLVESAMKRSANVKDSGSILPGHGGLLDRIDALLFASPMAVLVFLVGDAIIPPNFIFP